MVLPANGEGSTFFPAAACSAAIFATIARLFHYGNVIPIAVGLGLFQIGEFTFVLARTGMKAGALTEEIYNLVLTTAVVTMLLTPPLSGQTSRLYAFKKRHMKREPLQTINFQSDEIKDHVVIAGGGRVVVGRPEVGDGCVSRPRPRRTT